MSTRDLSKAKRGRGPRNCRNRNCGNEHQHVIVRMPSSSADEILVVGSGRSTYVWLGKDGECVGHAGGLAAMRELHAALGRALRVGTGEP